MKKIYLDSTLFLNSILYRDEKAKECNKILSRLYNGEFFGVTSFLTWDEVVHITNKNLGKSVGLKKGEEFLIFPNLIFVDVNKIVISKAQILMNEYNLNPRDAIHAATALLNNCNEIISDDADFDKIKELKRVKI